jgi:hypothetical protein
MSSSSTPWQVVITEQARELAEEIVARRGELLRQRGQAGTSIEGGASSTASTPKLRIAVWSFPDDDIEIAKTGAAEFSDVLIDALHEALGTRYRFISRAALDDLISDMEATGALVGRSGRERHEALLRRETEFDLLVSGAIRWRGRNRVSVVWRANSPTLGLVASTRPHTVILDDWLARPAVPQMTSDQAVAAAARDLTKRVGDFNELWLGGISYQHSGAQVEFGFYMQRKLANALAAQAAANLISERKLKVIERSSCADSVLEQSGALIAIEALDWPPECADAGAYRMSGNYFVDAESIELLISLEGRDHGTIPWSGRIRRDTVAQRLIPAADLESWRQSDVFEPGAFRLTSDRGPDPAYAIGEKIHLMMRLGRDSWVYCYHLNADGKVLPLLPNPYFWERFTEPRFSGGVLHTIPSPDTFPFDFVAEPPAGHELTKCFATSRDVTNELPEVMRGHSLAYLGDDLASRLIFVFHNLPKVDVAEASLAITITK